jgi:hypothetical protein
MAEQLTELSAKCGLQEEANSNLLQQLHRRDSNDMQAIRGEYSHTVQMLKQAPHSNPTPSQLPPPHLEAEACDRACPFATV